MLRHERSRLADFLGDVTLLLALGQLTANKVGNLAGGQVVALQVFNYLVGLVVVVVDEAGNRGLCGPPRATVAACAVVNQVTPWSIRVLAHGNRGLNPASLDRRANLRD
ncbi:hypothetical protein D3C85_1283320 [compost metagenome]